MRLNQVTLPAADVEVSSAFYEKLGLQLIVRSLPHYARFVCPDGQTTLSLHKSDRTDAAEGIWIYFEDDDLDNTVQQLQMRGIHIDEFPEDKPWLWREARLKDPGGNQLILYKAGENRLYPPWRLNEH